MKKSIVRNLSGKARWIVAGIGLVALLVNQAPAQVNAEQSARLAMVRFARQHKDHQVGNGQCTALVEQALRRAGFKGLTTRPATDLEKKNGLTAGMKNQGFTEEMYIWGTKLVALGKNGMRPLPHMGYVIQFENCYFQAPDGSNFTMAHHTAIVGSAEGTTMKIWHQNGPQGKIVVEDTLDLAWLKRGYYAMFVPVLAK